MEHKKVAFFPSQDSGVLFHVIQPPSRGHLEVSVWNRPEDNIFTLLDLNTDKVKPLNFLVIIGGHYLVRVKWKSRTSH